MNKTPSRIPQLASYLIREHNLYVVRASGEVTFNDILTHLRELMDDADYHSGINALYDFSAVERIAGNPEVFLQTAEMMNDHAIFSQPAKTAILLSPDDRVSYQVMQGYCIMTARSRVENQLFTNVNLARGFLELPDSLVLPE